ncbi:MAG: hypothetical protein ACK5BJ_16935 [Bacteroidota bacterium]
MRLIEMLLREHSKAQRDRIITYIGRNPKRFADLIQVFQDGPYRVTQRAAWPLSYCAALHPKLVQPHLGKLLTFAKKPGVHDAVKRNVVRLLQFIAIPKKHHAKTIDLCFGFLKNPKEPVAVRVFAMTVLANLAKQHPSLANEIIPMIETQLPYATAAFRNRGAKMLKELSKSW